MGGSQFGWVCLALHHCGPLTGHVCLLLVLLLLMLLLLMFRLGHFLLVCWFEVCHILGSRHWLIGAGDLGVGSVSYFELLILYERWAEGLVLEKGCALW